MTDMHFDLQELIKTVGYLGLFGIVFAESGLLFGFFLPGDSLLFTAGFLASQGFLDIGWLILICLVAAITGDNVGYAFGHKVGRKLFEKKDSRFFKKEHLIKAEEFYEKHGGKTIILARFMPFIRTFAPIVAGASKMEYSKFVFFNVVGGVIWVIGLSLLGYFLGSLLPAEVMDKYLLAIIGAIVLLSVAPSGIHLLREKIKSRDVSNSKS